MLLYFMRHSSIAAPKTAGENMTNYKQTLLSPLPASRIREQNYMKYDKYGCRIDRGRNNEMNTILAFFD